MHDKEYRLKFLNIDVKEIRAILEKIGAIKTFDGVVTDRYYLADSNLGEQVHPPIKLKDIGKGIHAIVEKKLEFKGNYRIVQERIDLYPSLKEACIVLRKMNRKIIPTYVKHRLSYSLKYSYVNIDKIPGAIPEYLDICAKDTNEIKFIAQELGLNIKEGKPWGFHQVRDYFMKSKNIDLLTPVLN